MEGIGEGERPGWARETMMRRGGVESGFEPGAKDAGGRGRLLREASGLNNLGICTRSGRYNDGKRCLDQGLLNMCTNVGNWSAERMDAESGPEGQLKSLGI